MKGVCWKTCFQLDEASDRRWATKLLKDHVGWVLSPCLMLIPLSIFDVKREATSSDIIVHCLSATSDCQKLFIQLSQFFNQGDECGRKTTGTNVCCIKGQLKGISSNVKEIPC